MAKSRKNMRSRRNRKYNYKKRKTQRKSYRRHYKQKGGICYGNGVGANNYDPNLSIYNTKELQLFPYNPN